MLQADAYAGFDRLYAAGREPGPILEAACWAHARRKLFELAAVSKAPIAAEAVRRIDRLFAIEREVNGRPAAERLAGREERAKPPVLGVEGGPRAPHPRGSPQSPTRQADPHPPHPWEG